MRSPAKSLNSLGFPRVMTLNRLARELVSRGGLDRCGKRMPARSALKLARAIREGRLDRCEALALMDRGRDLVYLRRATSPWEYALDAVRGLLADRRAELTLVPMRKPR